MQSNTRNKLQQTTVPTQTMNVKLKFYSLEDKQTKKLQQGKEKHTKPT